MTPSPLVFLAMAAATRFSGDGLFLRFLASLLKVVVVNSFYLLFGTYYTINPRHSTLHISKSAFFCRKKTKNFLI
jgi:hypothetical protein